MFVKDEQHLCVLAGKVLSRILTQQMEADLCCCLREQHSAIFWGKDRLVVLVESKGVSHSFCLRGRAEVNPQRGRGRGRKLCVEYEVYPVVHGP
jgi:hypothetical protein